MTWIVGCPSLLGHAMGLSDVRVTFADGSEVDCLRKVYRVGPQIAAGFAGSVLAGMNLLQRLADLLSAATPTEVWNPAEVAKWWPQDARDLFSQIPEAERTLRAEMILLASYFAPRPFGRAFVYTFTSPDFEPIKANTFDVVSIGKGSGIKTYREKLSALSQNFDLFKLEAGRPGGSALGLDLSITERIESLPIAGISPHLHVCLVFPDRVEIRTNDRRYFDGRPPFEMPPVANSYEEFIEFARSRGHSAAGASAWIGPRAVAPHAYGFCR